MFKDRIFRTAFIVSILVHGALLSPLKGLHTDRKMEKELEKLEVVYYEVKDNPPEKQELAKVEVPPAPKPAEAPHETVKVPEDGELPVEAEQETKELEKLKDEEDPELYAKAVEFKDLPREQKPLFLDYYRAIREKIKNTTDYPAGAKRNMVEGSTLLSFVLAKDGSLEEVVIKESSGNVLLDQSAYQSLENASPFPPFPLNLKQSYLRLSLQISYELD